MEEFKIKIKVFGSTGNEKKTLLNTVQNFIQSNNSDHEIAVVQSTGGDGRPILEEFFSNLGFNIMDYNRSAEESLPREDFLRRVNPTPAIMPELTFRLYNCDNMYDLDKVKALITKVTAKMYQQANVEKTYFPLPEMNNLCRKLDNEGKQRGYAVFVVHADEPGLIINSGTSVSGYSKLYRTLVRLTGDRVLIVIGGDDGYKDQEERDKSVLSRRALNKVRSQFNKKYLNGVKGFVFSWGESHHPIHEEALEFYLNPQKQGQEFVPLHKTELPCLALQKGDDDQKYSLKKEQQHEVKKETGETLGEAQAAAKSLPLFHVLSFYSKKRSISTVKKLLADMSKKLMPSVSFQFPYLLPNDFPQYIKDNKPEYVVLVSDMNDFKNVPHLDSWVELYQDVLDSIAIVEKSLIFVVCGDPDSNDDCLASDFIREQIFSLKLLLPPTRVTVMSWDAKPRTIHQYALLQLLDPSKGPEKKKPAEPTKEQAESWPEDAEIDPKKGRLRYRARIRRGEVVRVLNSDPPGWKPEETMLKQQLDRNQHLIGALEFWENQEGNITAVVENADPVSKVIGLYGKAFRGLWQE